MFRRILTASRISAWLAAGLFAAALFASPAAFGSTTVGFNLLGLPTAISGPAYVFYPLLLKAPSVPFGYTAPLSNGGAATFSDIFAIGTFPTEGLNQWTVDFSLGVSITEPGTASGTIDGSLTASTDSQSNVTGSVAWNNPLTLTTTTGDTVRISMSPVDLAANVPDCNVPDGVYLPSCALISATVALNPAAPVPEPGSMAVLATGLAGLGFVTWRRRARA